MRGPRYGRKTKISKWQRLPRPAAGKRGLHALPPAGKDEAGEETWDVVQVLAWHDYALFIVHVASVIVAMLYLSQV